MTQLRTLSHLPAFVMESDDCHQRGYVIDSTGVYGQGHSDRRSVKWDEHGMCRDNFFDSLICIDRWSKIPLKKREEISKYAEEGRHDLAIHEFEEEEFNLHRGSFFKGLLIASIISIFLWIGIYYVIFA